MAVVKSVKNAQQSNNNNTPKLVEKFDVKNDFGTAHINVYELNGIRGVACVFPQHPLMGMFLASMEIDGQKTPCKFTSYIEVPQDKAEEIQDSDCPRHNYFSWSRREVGDYYKGFPFDEVKCKNGFEVLGWDWNSETYDHGKVYTFEQITDKLFEAMTFVNNYLNPVEEPEEPEEPEEDEEPKREHTHSPRKTRKYAFDEYELKVYSPQLKRYFTFTGMTLEDVFSEASRKGFRSAVIDCQDTLADRNEELTLQEANKRLTEELEISPVMSSYSVIFRLSNVYHEVDNSYEDMEETEQIQAQWKKLVAELPLGGE